MKSCVNSGTQTNHQIEVRRTLAVHVKRRTSRRGGNAVATDNRTFLRWHCLPILGHTHWRSGLQNCSHATFVHKSRLRSISISQRYLLLLLAKAVRHWQIVLMAKNNL